MKSIYRSKLSPFKPYYWINQKLTGLFDFPVLNLEHVKHVLNLVSFNFLQTTKNFNCWIHFFIDDYQFERLWNNPWQYLELLKRVKGVITPDFSMYTDTPQAMNIWNCYRSRALARFLQDNGVNIIPTVSWSNLESLDWCFDGIPEWSAVAISTNGVMSNSKTKEIFIQGFNKMLEVIDPCQIVCVGNLPKDLQSKRVSILPTYGMKLNTLSARKDV